jgi:predicted CoA-binding protein
VASDKIERFLAVDSFVVVGASTNRQKYGNKVLRCYAQHDKPVVGVNPRADEIEGLPCYASLVHVPGPPRAVSIVAPPAFAQQIVNDAVATSVSHLWFQTGSEDAAAIADAEAHGLEVIAYGPCLLVALGFRDV